MKFFFVVGHARSGTTMLGRILGNHSDIHTFNELHFFDKVWKNTGAKTLSLEKSVDLLARLICISQNNVFMQARYREYRDEARSMLDHLDLPDYTELNIYRLFVTYTAREQQKTVACEHTPQYIFHLEEVFDSLGEIKIINLIRDPRDVILSMKARWKGRALSTRKRTFKMNLHAWVHYHPVFTSYLWKSSVEALDPYVHDERIHTVKYEDILRYPENEIRKICTFLRISFLPEMLKVPMVGSSLVPDRPDEKGIDETRTAKWKSGGLNATELFLIQKFTQPSMKRAGYEPVQSFPNLFLILFYFMTLPLKALLSLLLQIKDLKRLSHAIRRRLRG
ncbi:sulfotransferase [Acidobacteriota bacterium]